MTRILLSILALLLPSTLPADEAQVRLPLETYQQLVHAQPTPRPAPSGYALGTAVLEIAVHEDEQGAMSAVVDVTVPLDILEDEWTVVPILPAGTAVDDARVDDQPVRLVATADGLGWATSGRGRHSLRLRYRVDVRQFESGVTLAIPVPKAASSSMQATLPGSELEIAVVPAVGVETSEAGEGTEVKATIPSTSAIQISWNASRGPRQSISRATYTGTLENEVVHWTAELQVELNRAGTVTLPLLPVSVTLSDVRVDGKPSPIVVVGETFATRIQGRGPHTVVASFRSRVDGENGPSAVQFEIPEVPVSRFDLTIPGNKELTTDPPGSVTYDRSADRTVATAFVPMTNRVQLKWSEAVPEAAKSEKRVNASFLHAVYAEEGLLHARVSASYEVTRGEVGVLEVEVPADVQVSRVADGAGVITDWRIAPAESGKPRLLSVFLDRQLSSALSFEIECERSLGKAPLEVPVLRAANVQRQRGMVVLLSSKELTLNPAEEASVTRVGENQIPSAWRETFQLKVAHTFKYAEEAPRLAVTATPPERRPGKFDVQADTLVSLADVTLHGSLSIEVNVKSGTLSDLAILLPPRVNFLSLTAPSMRNYDVVDAGKAVLPGASTPEGEREVVVQFTQEMEGQFRLELTYEKILGEQDAEAALPHLRVRGAEVEQGRIAVEALSVMEVRARSTEHLTSLDPSELPRQLVLKTTNPILLAYKYVQADPAPELRLEMTRHRAIEVRAATIDDAVYRTLFTADGMAVTAADLTVRNSREQFLRLRLPPRSEVWSVFVNGHAEKPAIGANGETLVKIVTSAQGFPVQIAYATPVSPMGTLGFVRGVLPQTDTVTTRTRWEVFLPDDRAYGRIRSNLTIAEGATPASSEAVRSQLAKLRADAEVVSPLRIDVPISGTRLVLTKLYASQTGEAPAFAVTQVSAAGRWLVRLLTLAGAALVALALWRVASLGGAMWPMSFGSVGLALVVGAAWFFEIREAISIASVVAIVAAGAFVRLRGTRRLLPTVEPV